MRELNQRTAQVLHRVVRGETVEITSRGRPVARLVPIAAPQLSRLRQAGWLRSGDEPMELEPPTGRAAEGPSLVEAIEDDRADRL